VIAKSIEGAIGHVELVNTLFEPRVTGGGIGGQAPAAPTPEYQQSREALRQWRRCRRIPKRFRRRPASTRSSSLDATRANLGYMRRVLESGGDSVLSVSSSGLALRVT
jgi:hypothetical protein